MKLLLDQAGVDTSCEHAFVTSQGSAYTRFKRALSGGNPLIARAAAAECERIELADALALCLLHRDAEPSRYGPMVVRWHARFCREVRGVSLSDSQLLLAALSGLTRESPAAATVAEICDRYGLERAARVADNWR